MALLVVASGLYRLLANRMRGYGDAQARQIFRDLLNMPTTSRSRRTKWSPVPPTGSPSDHPGFGPDGSTGGGALVERPPTAAQDLTVA